MYIHEKCVNIENGVRKKWVGIGKPSSGYGQANYSGTDQPNVCACKRKWERTEL